jgi:aerotolerance regulator-like protein/VWA domain-containing protein
MGVLAPLYLAGLAALSLPLIFHLVRRTPRGRQEFSSLMFLLPSPPRLTRRSRLDQIVLLLLRLAALSLLAFAFARPFLRETATLALDQLPVRRVAILLDTSASTRRGDLWRQAIAAVEKELGDLGPNDEVALYTFSDRLTTEVGFDVGDVDSKSSRVEIIRDAARQLVPTWQATDLGSALVAVASEVDAASDVKQSAAERQVVVISDFQRGTKLDALQAFQWPEKVRVICRRLAPRQSTNAHAQLLTGEDDTADAQPRVRVANGADSKDDQFFVAWSSQQPAAGAKPPLRETAVYVPPGQSRVIKLPRPEDNLQADRILLRGDDHEFDNTFFVVPPKKQSVHLLYVGDDAADDEQGPQYYLHLAGEGDALRQLIIQPAANESTQPLTTEPLPQVVVVTRKIAADFIEGLKQYVERGGTLVLAPADDEAAAAVPALLEGVELSSKKPPASDHLLLGEIDFTHPLFMPFANPRYSDFTKIHFWKHRAFVIPEGAPATTVARFDNGEPAIFERSIGRGHIIVFASGWNPNDSELALSTKFVPLIATLLDRACGSTETLASSIVGQTIELPAPSSESSLTVRKPDGKESTVATNHSPLTTHHSLTFKDTDQPGIYEAIAASQAQPQRFAVNLAASESNTAPLELEQLEQLGVKTGVKLTRAEELKRKRQERDTELESRQKIWRWLLVGALGVLVFETLWAGRATRQISTAEARG